MSIHEECGVFGVMAQRPEDVASLVYFGLYSLQHRGQESCGIVVNDDGVFASHKDIGLIKNKYIGRTFIAPDHRLDQVKIKLSAIEDVVRGKRVVLIDDSIVRGTTSGRIVALLREAGAKEIHMRISSPPFLHPCYYGTDIDSRDHLIACHHTVEEIAGIIGADTLGYLPVKDLYALAGKDIYCSACFTGEYPTPVPADTRKNRFERRLSE